jgi:predicted 2-oxoglutarate/Fe(II)-dependent dioxygenase YbiX
MSDDPDALDPLRLCRALVDEVRLLPDDDLAAVLLGARLRRDALALARARGERVDEGQLRLALQGFRRTRGLLKGDALTPWLRDRGSHPEDLARWMRDEATLQRVTLSAESLAPRDIADFARVAEGTDALWSRAQRACRAAPSTLPDEDVLTRFFDEGGRAPPNDLAAWSADRGFDAPLDALAAMRLRISQVTAAARAQPLGAGDFAPALTLRGAATGPLRLSDLAGNTVILCVCRSQAAAERMRARWRDDPRDAMVVCDTPGDDDPRVPWLVDAPSSLAAALGLGDKSAMVVLDPAGRIAAVTADPDVAARAFDDVRGAPTAVGSPAPVLVVPGVFSPEECASLIERWAREGHQRGAITGRTAHGADTWTDAAIKRRADHVISDPALDAWITERLARRVGPTLLRAFHFTVTDHEAYRVGCYDAAARGAFGAHRDDENPAVASRRFALSVNLNPGEYDGGGLHLPEHGALLHTPRGAAAVYSASLLHAVTEVTRGRRFALVGFFRGAFRGG